MAEIPPIKIPEIDLSGLIDSMTRVVRPIKLHTVALEVIEEVASAHAKHGPNKDLVDGTGHYDSVIKSAMYDGGHHNLLDGGYVPDNEDMAQLFKDYNDTACADGRKHTRLGILLEEAFEAAETDNDADLRKELIQVAAMALDWIVDIDDRATEIDDLDKEV